MGFFDNIADKLDDAKRSAKRSARRARKTTNSDSTLEAAGKIVGRTTGKVVGALAVTAMELGKAAYEVAQEKSEKIQTLKAELARYNDEELINIFKTSTGFRKGVAASILKDRGYGRN